MTRSGPAWAAWPGSSGECPLHKTSPDEQEKGNVSTYSLTSGIDDGIVPLILPVAMNARRPRRGAPAADKFAPFHWGSQRLSATAVDQKTSLPRRAPRGAPDAGSHHTSVCLFCSLNQATRKNQLPVPPSRKEALRRGALVKIMRSFLIFIVPV